MKTLVFVTSFLSPHVYPFLNNLREHYTILGCVQTIYMTQERRDLGYEIQDTPFPVFSYQDFPEKCEDLIQNADIVIMACGDFSLINKRIKVNKAIYLMHERIFKKGIVKIVDPRLWKYIRISILSKQKNIYLLAIGNKAAKDFFSIGFAKEKIFSFGYFPDYELFEKKHENTERIEILWVGRMVGFKRPLMAAKAVKDITPKFHLTMIGDGKLMHVVKNYVNRNHLDVDLIGRVQNDEVKKAMQKSHILLSTSNKGEGWGAVINEGMSCGCAIVCSDSIGCYGTLVDNDNSCIFQTYSMKSLRQAIFKAATDFHYYSNKSIETIKTKVNAYEAAERFHDLDKSLSGESEGHFYSEGICSRVLI